MKDGELGMGWQGMTESQRRGKLVVFAGPYQSRAYRLREGDLGFYIVRDEGKVYLSQPSVLEAFE